MTQDPSQADEGRRTRALLLVAAALVLFLVAASVIGSWAFEGGPEGSPGGFQVPAELLTRTSDESPRPFATTAEGRRNDGIHVELPEAQAVAVRDEIAGSLPEGFVIFLGADSVSEAGDPVVELVVARGRDASDAVTFMGGPATCLTDLNDWSGIELFRVQPEEVTVIAEEPQSGLERVAAACPDAQIEVESESGRLRLAW